MTLYELNQIGAEVAELLKKGYFNDVSSTYGNALSFGRDLEQSVKEDFEQACNEAIGNIVNAKLSINSRYFEENNAGLVALIECDFSFEHSTGVLVELVLNANGLVYLEQISSYMGGSNA